MPTTAPCRDCLALVNGMTENAMHHWLREMPAEPGTTRFSCLICLSELVGKPGEAFVQWELMPR